MKSVPVMLSLETLSCFKTVLRQCFDCLGLGLGLRPWCLGLRVGVLVLVLVSDLAVSARLQNRYVT
jgi:hypothetical protein